MNEPVISVCDLSFTYDEEGSARAALSGINLNIGQGCFVAVTGRNGCGKSTLAKNLNAILLPSGGAVFVRGLDTRDAENTLAIRRLVGMVFQNPDNQLVSSIVEDDVAFGPENLGVPPEDIRRRVDSSLKAVGMYELKNKAPHLLSGGQKQRVAIAGVLAMEPEVIVFDEPTAMLDPKGRREIMKIIKELHESGKTVVLITHFMEEAAMADRMIVMKDGVIVKDGAPAELFKDAAELKALGLELPFTVELSARLRALGVNLPQNAVTEEALCEEIIKAAASK